MSAADDGRALVSGAAAVGAAALGAYGSLRDGTPYPGLVAAAFAVTYFTALRRAQNSAATPALQLPLVISLVALSFALHLMFLPAGLACMFALMLGRNESFFPPRSRGARPRPPGKAE